MMGLSLIVVSLLCLTLLMALAMVVISSWSHNTHISQDGWIDEPQQPDTTPPDKLIDDVCDLAQSGQKVEAIKLYRQTTGAGLKEAKEAVEALDCDQ